ncbi:MAG: hypothetical protein PHR90_07025 [Sphaerochaetaceae bacterium]|nr:hypothetical protein [Sphaerochaetaceae bacterium]MDD3942212.1 hypothetical protein [Sphaerochaetaceae bacterium]MDX9940095.1 hypothetical protein [Sphaerochaetaceae bacterium]
MNRFMHGSKAQTSGRLAVILIIMILLFGVSGLYAETLLSTDYLYLNTNIPSNSSFIINGADPDNNVVLTLGQPSPPLSYVFTYTGTNIVSITITSSNGTGSQMRLKHLEADAYIPYQMKFDYDGQGLLPAETVVNGTARDLVKYNGNYNELSGGIQFITPSDDSYLAGDYKDTITFSFVGI